MGVDRAFRSAVWIGGRPQYFFEFVRKALYRSCLKSKMQEASQATKQLSQAISENKAFQRSFPEAINAPHFEERYQSEISQSQTRMDSNYDKMGEAVGLSFLRPFNLQIRPDGVLEAGVAYDWFAVATQSALALNQSGKLISINFPQLGTTWHSVAVTISKKLKERWSLLVGFDCATLATAIASFHSLQFCHYDRDKSNAGKSANPLPGTPSDMAFF